MHRRGRRILGWLLTGAMCATLTYAGKVSEGLLGDNDHRGYETWIIDGNCYFVEVSLNEMWIYDLGPSRGLSPNRSGAGAPTRESIRDAVRRYTRERFSGAPQQNTPAAEGDTLEAALLSLRRVTLRIPPTASATLTPDILSSALVIQFKGQHTTKGFTLPINNIMFMGGSPFKRCHAYALAPKGWTIRTRPDIDDIGWTTWKQTPVPRFGQVAPVPTVKPSPTEPGKTPKKTMQTPKSLKPQE